MSISDLIDQIIEKQKDKTVKDIEFCCGVCDLKNPVNIIETDKIKIIYRENGECTVERKANDNPVICRSADKKIYRQHGEWNYLKHEMYILAGMTEEAKNLLTELERNRDKLLCKDFQYD